MDKIIYMLFEIFLLFIIYCGYKILKWVNILYEGIKKPECHCCGSETELEWVCDRCEEFYCENCSAPFTYHNQIDYPCCESCYKVYYD